MHQKKLVIHIEGSLVEFLSSADSSTESKPNLFVLVQPSLLHHTFLLGPARFNALHISALLRTYNMRKFWFKNATLEILQRKVNARVYARKILL